MRATILVDNCTLTDRYFLAEPGFCLLLEHEGQRTLLDTGYSDIFLTNAAKMGQDLLQLERVVLSHGHLDHSWGLSHLLTRRNEAVMEGLLPATTGQTPPELVAHPLAMDAKQVQEQGSLVEIGCMLPPAMLERHFRLRLSSEPLWLSEKLLFLGQVPRRFEFEHTPPLGVAATGDSKNVPDTLEDDTALAWIGDKGVVLLTGCSHAGICNIAAHACELTGVDTITDIVGGLHLLDAPAHRLEATAAYLAGLGLDALHACHCTDLAAKIALSHTLPVREAGVGLVLDYQ